MSPHEVEAMSALEFIQGGRASRRFHTMPMLDYQRIDSHSYGVAVLTRVLTPNADPARRARLLEAALFHDLAEHIAGDIPAPIKRGLSKAWRDEYTLYEDLLLARENLEVTLNERDHRVLKLADAADGCLHCIDELMHGNRHIIPIYDKFLSYVMEEQLLMEHPEWREEGELVLSQYLDTKWREANGDYT